MQSRRSGKEVLLNALDKRRGRSHVGNKKEKNGGQCAVGTSSREWSSSDKGVRKKKWKINKRILIRKISLRSLYAVQRKLH